MQLIHLQTEFVKSLLLNNDLPNLQHAQNIAIYRNNIWSTHIQSLILTYPLIYKLIGEKCFRSIAEAYAKQYPSRTGNLYDYGEYFSDFLSNHDAVRHLAYLTEVAQFEWLCHLLYHAANDAKQYYIMQCQYPLLQIVDLCEGKTDDPVDSSKNVMNLLILRRNFTIHLQPLTIGEFTFLTTINENQSFDEAVKMAYQKDSQFDLAKKLPLWVQSGVIRINEDC